jgi:RecJ-like exonuclease
MTICSMCNGMGKLDELESELCAFCGGTGKYSATEDNEAIAMLDDASAGKEVKAGDVARVADYLRMTKRRV